MLKKTSSESVCVVGAAIMDIFGFPKGKLPLKDSTPGLLKMSPGGVGRNIAENLARLGLPVSLIAAFGDDAPSKQLASDAKKDGINIEKSLFVENHSAATYMAIMDEENDLVAGIAVLEILDKLGPAFLAQQKTFLNQVKTLVIETNIPEDSIEYLTREFKQAKLYVDAVSIPLSQRIRPLLDRFQVVKANLFEAEALLGHSISGKEEILNAAKTLVASGPESIFITLGKDGVAYCNQQENGFLKLPPLPAVNTTGAGDAFLAGLVLADQLNLSLRKGALLASICSRFALSSKRVVNPEISFEKVNELFEQFKPSHIPV